MTATRAAYLRNILREIRELLESLGFRYQGRRWYDKQLNADVLGVVALPSTTYRDDPVIYVNPSVGVTDLRLERLITDLSGRNTGKFLPATVGSSIGYVTPASRFITYSFAPNENVETAARRMIEAIKASALPWMEAHNKLELMLPDLLNFKYSTRDQARFEIPGAYYILGDHKSARDWVAHGLKEIESFQGTYAAQYRQFSARLLARINQRT